MSTCYNFTDILSKKQVKKAMKSLGLTIARSKDADATQFCITDGSCYVWAYCSPDGSNVSFCRYGANYDAFDNILEPLAVALQTDCVSEEEDSFWEEDEEVEEPPKKKAKKKTKKKTKKKSKKKKTSKR